MPTRMKFGLLVPHFGEHAAVAKVIEGSQKAEAYGFDSIWVRDHLIFHPHGMEGTDKTLFEPFVTLGAIGARTNRLVLGTAVAIPHRHPIYLAQLFATLSHLTGGRVICGIGAGTFAHEIGAAGWPSSDEHRFQLTKETIEVMRRIWTGEEISYKGEIHSFEHADIHPQPAKPIPIWYGGGTPASVRRTIAWECDGWMPGRIPLRTFQKCVGLLRDLCREHGRPMVITGALPIVSVDRDKENALSKVNVKGLWETADKKRGWVKPASGRFSTLEDLEGLLIAGSPSDVVKEIQKYEANGLDHFVFDLRFRYPDYERQLDLIGQEVLPLLRA